MIKMVNFMLCRFIIKKIAKQKQNLSKNPSHLNTKISRTDRQGMAQYMTSLPRVQGTDPAGLWVHVKDSQLCCQIMENGLKELDRWRCNYQEGAEVIQKRLGVWI